MLKMLAVGIACIAVGLSGCDTGQVRPESSAGGAPSAAIAVSPAPSTSEPPLAGPSSTDGGPVMPERTGKCPMQVPGTKAVERESPGGVTLAFTTTGDVLEVRDRVRAMAEMHNRLDSMDTGEARATGRLRDAGILTRHEATVGAMRGDGMRGRAIRGTTRWLGASAQAQAEDIEGGARVVLVARNLQDVEMLRSHVHEQAQRMTLGQCPMDEQ